MSIDANKALVKELFAAWAAHDVDRACACIAESCNGGGPEGCRRELTIGSMSKDTPR